jgi:tetratricopeptide (TPR) repeat protein
LALCELVELAVAYERSETKLVLARIGNVIEVLREEGAFVESEGARFLEACALKSEDRLEESAARLTEMLQGEAKARNPLVYSLTHVALAEVLAKAGRHAEAQALFRRAASGLPGISSPIAAANFHSTVAEVVRDLGMLADAIDNYRSSVAIFDRAGMARGAGYTRVLLAETLVGAGREVEAIDELMKALPVIYAEKLSSEAQATAALLRESIRRQCLDSAALSQLRSQLRSLGDCSEA